MIKKLTEILKEIEQEQKANTNEGWEEKDNKKIRGNVDRSKVACGSEDWEKDPVFKKMKSENNSLTKEQLDKAFKACCKEVPAPQERKAFEACMRKKLKE